MSQFSLLIMSVLVHRLRRCPNVDPGMGGCLVLPGELAQNTTHWAGVKLMLAYRL